MTHPFGTKGTAFPAIGNAFACTVVEVDDVRNEIVVRCRRGTRRIPYNRFRPDEPPLPAHRHVLTSQPSYELGTGVPQPKETEWREPRYRHFVREHPCLRCDSTVNVQAAHYGGPGTSGGVGLKAPDWTCIPLCAECHRRQHDGGLSAIGLTLEDVYRAQRDVLAAWIMRGET